MLKGRKDKIRRHQESAVPAGHQSGGAVGRVGPSGEKGLHQMRVCFGVISSILAYSVGVRSQRRSVGSGDHRAWDGAVVDLGAKSGGCVV